MPEHHLVAESLDSGRLVALDRKSTRLNSSHRCISYAVFCLKKKVSLYAGTMTDNERAAGSCKFVSGLGSADSWETYWRSGGVEGFFLNAKGTSKDINSFPPHECTG